MATDKNSFWSSYPVCGKLALVWNDFLLRALKTGIASIPKFNGQFKLQNLDSKCWDKKVFWFSSGSIFQSKKFLSCKGNHLMLGNLNMKKQKTWKILVFYLSIPNIRTKVVPNTEASHNGSIAAFGPRDPGLNPGWSAVSNWNQYLCEANNTSLWLSDADCNPMWVGVAL